MNGPISQWIADLGIWPLLVMLLPNLFLFRKHGQVVAKKRMASLMQAIAVFLFTMSAALIVSMGGSDAYLLLSLVIIAGVSYLLRARMFPYRLTCPECGRKHEVFTPEFKNIYVMDDDLCDECRRRAEGHQEDADEDADEDDDVDEEVDDDPDDDLDDDIADEADDEDDFEDDADDDVFQDDEAESTDRKSVV